MAIVIVVLLGLAILHLVYEGIIVPMIRLHLRYKLFALRDELREFHYHNPKDISPDKFRYLEESINVVIAFLYRIDIMAIWESERVLKADPDLMERIQKREAELSACTVKEFKAIRYKTVLYFGKALLVNNACLLVYMVPVFLLTVILGRIRCMWERFKDALEKMSCIPEGEKGKLLAYA